MNSPEVKSRNVARASVPDVLADIYHEQVNMAVWRRQLPPELQTEIAEYLRSNPVLDVSRVIAVDAVDSELEGFLGKNAGIGVLQASVAELVSMFAILFDLQHVGLRLKLLQHAMCPRFHVDKVPCRLVTTFCGAGTQWIAHQDVNRAALNRNTGDRNTTQGDLFSSDEAIQSLAVGDVALLKGESWEGNENAGLVHRSPPASGCEQRLLLTLDFVQ